MIRVGAWVRRRKAWTRPTTLHVDCEEAPPGDTMRRFSIRTLMALISLRDGLPDRSRRSCHGPSLRSADRRFRAMLAHRVDLRACCFAKSIRARCFSASVRRAYSPLECCAAQSRYDSSSNLHALLATGFFGNIGEHPNQSGDALIGPDVLSTTKSVVPILPTESNRSREHSVTKRGKRPIRACVA
jgi:hypothetical protein